MSARPTYPQLEHLVNFLEENPGVAKGHLRSTQAKWETRRKWEQIAVTLNAMGGAEKDAKGWTKFWIDKKYALKKFLGQSNADANRTEGGGPADLPSLSSVEERMLAIMGGRGFAEGDFQFSVPVLPSQDQPAPELTSNPEPSTSIQDPEILEQEDDVSWPTLASPDRIPLLASTLSNPRRSPRIQARSRQSASTRRPLERGRRSQIQIERDRLVSIEERRVEAEQNVARALQENMSELAAACNNIAEAIATVGTKLVLVLETLLQPREA